MTVEQGESIFPRLVCEERGGVLCCRFEGQWTLTTGERKVSRQTWRRALAKHEVLSEVRFEVGEGVKWDSSLAAFLATCLSDCSEKELHFDLFLLPSGLRKLFQMTEVKPTGTMDADEEEEMGPLGGIGLFVFFARDAIASALSFLGEWTIALLRLFTFRARFRVGDFLDACRACGAAALPIVTLVSFLTGLTMAFVGSVQLEKFNARIYVADLVSLAMVREMGGLMVGIVMAGRTGAAFAAELGNMKLNEEIDSLPTFGIAPMEFLVLPRTLALFVMTPLLALYADVVGILGGLFVGTALMDFSLLHYLEQTQTALNSMWEVYSGLMKSLAFGWIIGMVGCLRGLHCGNDSAALGQAVTSAVVTSITLVVVVDACFEVFYSMMDLR